MQADRPEDVAARIRLALDSIAPKQLIAPSDGGFGRRGVNRDIACFESTAIAQATNLVRRALGLPTTRNPAADPALQTDIVLGLGLRSRILEGLGGSW